MYQYRVIENRVADKQLALKCTFGRCHRARLLGGGPEVGSVLQGARPHLGFAILLCTHSGSVFRVIFETTNGVSEEFTLVRPRLVLPGFGGGAAAVAVAVAI